MTRSASVILTLVLDVALVVAFAAAGRASHDSDVLAGLAQTSWPFLVGLAIGWLLTRAWRAPLAPIRTGIGVWAATLAFGMFLRVMSGQGIALSFIIVAGVVLFAFLVGWRAIAHGIRSVRSRRAVTRSQEVSA